MAAIFTIHALPFTLSLLCLTHSPPPSVFPSKTDHSPVPDDIHVLTGGGQSHLKLNGLCTAPHLGHTQPYIAGIFFSLRLSAQHSIHNPSMVVVTISLPHFLQFILRLPPSFVSCSVFPNRSGGREANYYTYQPLVFSATQIHIFVNHVHPAF